MKSYCEHIGDPTQCPFCNEDAYYIDLELSDLMRINKRHNVFIS